MVVEALSEKTLRATFREYVLLLPFLPSLPIQLTIFAAAQEHGLVVFLGFAEGHVAAAVEALDAGVLELVLGHARGQVEVVGAAEAAGGHVGEAQAVVLGYDVVEVAALNGKVKLPAPNALGNHELKHDENVEK